MESKTWNSVSGSCIPKYHISPAGKKKGNDYTKLQNVNAGLPSRFIHDSFHQQH